MMIDSETERKLARTLLMELMVYQFASPVRWIETQEVILSRTKSDRIIEVGPSATLLGMLRKTIDTIHSTKECTLPAPRQLLHSEKDLDEIYYTGQPDQFNPVQIETQTETQMSPPKPEAALPAPTATMDVTTTALPSSRVHVEVVEIDDQSIQAQDIVFAIVARALKRVTAEIDGSKSIKALTEGRSTLENEIIGDLHGEFGSLPDRAEDLPLAQVGPEIQSSHKGALGKVTTAMINNLFTAKMPSNFTVATARRQLRTQWGLQPGRQDACLLCAVTMQPTSRVTSESDAHDFVSHVVDTYAKREGLTLLQPDASNVGGAATGVTIDLEAVRALTESQDALSKRLLEIYATHLGVDLDADRQALDSLRDEVATGLQADLDLWHAEHGSDYAQGIRPRFDSKKIRSYNSSWNWARQSLLELFDRVSTVTDPSMLDRDSIAKSCYHIANAADKTILPVLDELISQLQDRTQFRPIFLALRENCTDSLLAGPVFRGAPRQLTPVTTMDDQGNLQYREQPRKESAHFADLAMPRSEHAEKPLVAAEPYLHLKKRSVSGWEYSAELTHHLYQALRDVETKGDSLSDQTVLITGAGIGSIGAAMIVHFLQGGARVLVTTSSMSPEVARKYQALYMEHGARGSELVVVPFNQGSTQDITALVEYVYDEKKGLGWDLDYLVPFAAISEAGRTLDTIDSKSELAHRIMLTNLLRLLGTVKNNKEAHGHRSHPTQVVLPLSPNHGTFGGDGLYSESKIALETLFNRWHSENWQEYLSICGAVIGWTRGTGLMNQNDLVAEGIEKAGMRTFSREEMAYALVCLCVGAMYELCQEAPVYADLTGGMAQVHNLPESVAQLRQDLKERSEIQAALFQEDKIESEWSSPAAQDTAVSELEQRAHVRQDFPQILQYDRDIAPLSEDLQGMVDLNRTVVVTGFSELGPHGNSRTRWEMEAQGHFSLEGAIEMAWMMGFITHFSGIIEGQPYSGWVDTETKQPVADTAIKPIYEEKILAHSGIRFIEPELCDGYDPEKKQFLHEIVLQADLEPLCVPGLLAEQMRREHGVFVTVQKSSTPDLYQVQLRKGARVFIPRAMQFDRAVAGLVPTGWDPRIYGLPDQIISEVDRLTLYTLVCTVEALLSSGITDPYELYQYIHVSEVGNCIGSGMGGSTSLRKMFNGRFIGQEVQSDILQETFVNTISAWVNMLLLSASGPIRTPVGACATAVESLELGYDTIVTGKAKFCLVGGCDDFTSETSFEFANMKATTNSIEEIARGRAPSEMSRPTTTTRNGFMESQGCGLQVLTTADLALKMGLPIRGIVAFVSTSSDKASRSVPAPGQGVLVNARRTISASNLSSPLLKMINRRRRLDFRRKQIAEARALALDQLDFEVDVVLEQDPGVDVVKYRKERHEQIRMDFLQEERDAQYSLGNDFWRHDTSIAPLTGALATWGLTIDDLRVASFHGTSTMLNDKNESSVLQQQLTALGRRKGNLLLGVFQKHLTGHSKGAAGAWMVNGALQMLDSGLVPGNRNADNIDSALQQFDLIAYLNRPVHVPDLKAVSITSFGFGQKGAQAICVHPRHVFATLTRDEYEAYLARRMARQRITDAYFYEGMSSNSLFRAKTAPPFPVSQENETYLDASARFSL
ncbi:Fatty acid synthase subunit alpha, putative [Penicillium digitatum]|uniref:Fatty acid synthase subunit alpha, putative n=3 Tax=Penicillium digitatum TaxID=36651 RepID=K9G5P5_PEND2|nr:Fatty acid synthase subunit alpha, putative [Penicillium digitatum Pd1]EKV04372.1 Fatty acid synthase subunit alpha, putative [Penicillium digitatum Pd1]EKV17250.1 Fatty acid synthase subunit alpha, putative [Penicillium digitatum PHI26]QQK39825.1 Fatty acid synthase subunit alpha, putative [Penicillium digitatum]